MAHSVQYLFCSSISSCWSNTWCCENWIDLLAQTVSCFFGSASFLSIINKDQMMNEWKEKCSGKKCNCLTARWIKVLKSGARIYRTPVNTFISKLNGLHDWRNSVTNLNNGVIFLLPMGAHSEFANDVAAILSCLYLALSTGLKTFGSEGCTTNWTDCCRGRAKAELRRIAFPSRHQPRVRLLCAYVGNRKLTSSIFRILWYAGVECGIQGMIWGMAAT